MRVKMLIVGTTVAATGVLSACGTGTPVATSPKAATQSATAILYVCSILIFIGEMIALPLVRDTGLPF